MLFAEALLELENDTVVNPKTDSLVLRAIAATFEILEADLKTVFSPKGKLTLTFENGLVKVVIRKNEKGDVVISTE